MNLAEIVAEGKRLEANVARVTAERDADRRRIGYAWTHDMIDAHNERISFYLQHGPTLLAAVGAAVEFDAADCAYAADCDGGGRASWRLFRAREALRKLILGTASDAAAGGGGR